MTASRALGSKTALEGQTVIESGAVRVSRLDLSEYVIFWEWPPTICAVACDVKIFMATIVLLSADLSLYY